MALLPTPNQTIGPFFHYALPSNREESLVDEDHPDAIRIVGRVLDGAGEPVADAMLEVWQANRAGRYAHPEDRREDLALEEGFSGFGRLATDEAGGFEIVTVKPGPVPGPGGRLQAPHIEVAVFARGILRHLVTRIYFPDEERANAADPVLALLESDRRPLLVARQEAGVLRHEIRLQGELETPFMDV